MTDAAQARAALVGLTNAARRDLFEVWASLAGLEPGQVAAALRDLLPEMGDRYGEAAAALAADWYDDLRSEAGVAGAFVARPAPLADGGRWLSLVEWGTAPLFAEQPNPDVALTRVSGGLQRTVADAHRLTIVESTQADPKASGWRRVGVGDNCGFCRMLIANGHVYSKASVTFRSHDHCNCAAAPSFDPSATVVTGEPFRQSKRRRSDATKAKDNERARAWIAEHIDD